MLMILLIYGINIED